MREVLAARVAIFLTGQQTFVKWQRMPQSISRSLAVWIRSERRRASTGSNASRNGVILGLAGSQDHTLSCRAHERRESRLLSFVTVAADGRWRWQLRLDLAQRKHRLGGDLSKAV